MKDKVIKRIRELVPELQEKQHVCGGCGYAPNHCKKHKTCPRFYLELTIHLEHILLAIHRHTNFKERPYQPEVSIEIDDIVNIHYDPLIPFTEQDEELYKLLAELLIKT